MLRKPNPPRRPTSQVKVNYRLCHFCGACVGACPANAMFLYNTYLMILEDGCTHCERCLNACPLHALYFESLSSEMHI